MTETTRTIMAGDLSGRLPIAGTDDELDRLAGQSQRHAGAHRGADARPQGGLRQHRARSQDAADAAAQPRRGGAAHRPRTNRNTARRWKRTIEESDELIRTFNALLMIARAESGQARDDMTEFDAAEIARGVGELYEPLADDKGLDAQGRGAGSRAGARQPRAGQPGARQSGRQRHQIRRAPTARAGERRAGRDRGQGAKRGRPDPADGRRQRPGHCRGRPRPRGRALRAAGAEPLAAGLGPGPEPRLGGRAPARRRAQARGQRARACRPCWRCRAAWPRLPQPAAGGTRRRSGFLLAKLAVSRLAHDNVAAMAASSQRQRTRRAARTLARAHRRRRRGCPRRRPRRARSTTGSPRSAAIAAGKRCRRLFAAHPQVEALLARPRRRLAVSLGSCVAPIPRGWCACSSPIPTRTSTRSWPNRARDRRDHGRSRGDAAAAPHEGGGGAADRARRYRRRLAGDAGRRARSPSLPIPRSARRCASCWRRGARAASSSPPIRREPEDGSGYIVLAMGKMGACELNYSSDIDLIVFYDADAPALVAEAPSRRRSTCASRAAW